jgi:hypothetical protein
MIYAYKKDKLKLDKLPDSLVSKIKDVADGRKKKKGKGKTKGISLKDAKDFAKTKHKGLPEYVSNESLNETTIVVLTFDEHEIVNNFNFQEIGIDINNINLEKELEDEELADDAENELEIDAINKTGKSFDDNQENMLVQSESIIIKFKDFI